MAVNMALKRARKAQRRKQVVAEKQRAETVQTGLPARVLRAAQAPIQHCLLTEGLFEAGMGTLILARGATPHLLASGVFLLDVFCLGIKDVMFESLERDELARYVEATDAGSPLVSITPSDARKLLRGLAAWSHSIGFPPHRDFAAVERLFGDVNADADDSFDMVRRSLRLLTEEMIDLAQEQEIGPRTAAHLMAAARYETLMQRLGAEADHRTLL